MTKTNVQPHGTRHRYRDGCRCDTCRAHNTALVRAYRLRKAREAWGAQPPQMVDAEPVRAHVRSLMAAGVGWKRIARLAGLSEGAITNLLYGRPNKLPATRLKRPTAKRLMALRAEDCVADGAFVDASGTRRRVQALMAAGWTRSEIGRRLGVEPTNMPSILNARRVRARRVRQVRGLFEELWDWPPPEGRYSERARAMARELGWPPPGGWDDDLIDLPEDELAAELKRRAAAMDGRELAACFTAHYRHGDLSPLVVAGARECGRRRARAVAAS